MQLHHYIVLLIALIVGYYVGANYKLGIPVLG
jgi:hypothetical protein